MPERRLVWTDALEGGYRPARGTPQHGLRMTAIIALEPSGTGTRYVATVLHADEEARKRHEDMGFAEGWAKALEQLVAHIRSAGGR